MSPFIKHEPEEKKAELKKEEEATIKTVVKETVKEELKPTEKAKEENQPAVEQVKPVEKKDS